MKPKICHQRDPVLQLKKLKSSIINKMKNNKTILITFSINQLQIQEMVKFSIPCIKNIGGYLMKP